MPKTFLLCFHVAFVVLLRGDFQRHPLCDLDAVPLKLVHLVRLFVSSLTLCIPSLSGMAAETS